MRNNMEYFGQTPDGEHNLWRYTSFAKLLNILDEDNTMDLISYRSDRLDDDYEGTLSERAKTEIESALLEESANEFDRMFRPTRGKYPAAAEGDFRQDYMIERADSADQNVKEMVERMREITFVNCWSDRKFEDSNMWRAYTSKSDGVVIKTTFDRMQDSIVGFDGILYLGNVNYINFDEEDMKRDAIAPFFYKQQQFESESEFRLTVTDYKESHLNLNDGAEEMPSPTHRLKRPIKVDPDELIKEIRVHPESTDYFRRVVEETLQMKNIDVPVAESSLKPSLA